MRFRWLATAAPPAEGDPDDLLTIADITDYTGLKRGTINADISRGRWAAPTTPDTTSSGGSAAPWTTS
ncbi:hypothetical protein [Nonomuraea glycinis]|uniref:hypothetical protein n=1 Tax=Nonomuraea glycinis TaxID=2047744 RepID=UPI002E14BDC8|nr:hypothetical protein OHA68_00900 [Nonomuraea glycinis]